MKTILSLAVAALTTALFLAPGTAEAAKDKKKDAKLVASFKKLDTDSDGKLSTVEFAKFEPKKKKAGATPKKPGKANKKLDALFAKLDANKDGSLSLDEFKKLNEVQKDKKKKKDK